MYVRAYRQGPSHPSIHPVQSTWTSRKKRGQPSRPREPPAKSQVVQGWDPFAVKAPTHSLPFWLPAHLLVCTWRQSPCACPRGFPFARRLLLVVTLPDCATRPVLHPLHTRPRTRRIPGRQSYTRSQPVGALKFLTPPDCSSQHNAPASSAHPLLLVRTPR